MTKAQSVAIVGRGRVGRTLASRLRERGQRVVLLPARGLGVSAATRRALEAATLVWLAVPDPHLDAVVEVLRGQLWGRARMPIVAHASGAKSPEVLAPLRALGAPVASAHPVLSFGTTKTSLEGAIFVLAGDRRACRALASLVRALGGRPVEYAVHGPRYHASLALAANGATALAAIALELLVSGEVALAPVDAQRALAGLLRSVADNLGRVGPNAALTGPIARGDVAAVSAHLAALTPEERPDYVAVSRLVLRAARGAGLGSAEASAIERVLDDASRARTPRRVQSVIR